MQKTLELPYVVSMPDFKFSERSLKNLEGVHPDLVRVVKRALSLSPVDFVVTEGLRTLERQKDLLKTGASKTLNSRHLTGHAVDVAAWVGGVKWEWVYYEKIARAMFDAAKIENVPITWGGDWKFKDGPHFELNWSAYK